MRFFLWFSILCTQAALLPLLQAYDWQVALRNGVPQILRDGKPYPSRIFWGNYYYATNPMGKGSRLLEEIKMAVDHGVYLITLQVKPIWCNPEKDQKELEKLCRIILDLDPKIQLIPRVRMYAPPEWIKAHPEEMMKLDKGPQPKDGTWASVASQRYRHDAGAALRRTIRFLEKRFPGRIAGYHPNGGNTGEWFYRGSQFEPLNGYDPSTLTAFRAWLKMKYRTDAALQKAWQDPKVTFGTAAVPTPAARRGTPEKSLRQPCDGMQVSDFVAFQSDNMAEMVISLGRIIREECGHKRLSITFFGYLFELGSLRNGPGNAGHAALRKVLDSKCFDVITAPFSYDDRTLKHYGAVMAPAESIERAGILWLNEDDTSTHIAGEIGRRMPGYWALGAKNRDESLKLLKRNLLLGLTHNYGVWWMDLFDHGWFIDKSLWEMMQTLEPLEKELLEHPQIYAPEAALVADPASFPYFVSDGGTKSTLNTTLRHARGILSNAGLNYGLYMQDDWLTGRIHPKICIYGSTLALNASDRKILAARARESAALWLWAPGYVDLETGRFSVKAVEELTGFEVTLQPVKHFTVTATAAGRKAGLPALFGPVKWDDAVDPVLSPVPRKGDVVLANYQENGAPAVVLRMGKHPAVFSGTPGFPQELIRYLGKLEKLHFYCARPLHVYRNGSILAFHFPAAGRYKIDLADGCSYTDFETGRAVPAKVERQATEGEVWLLRRSQKR